MKSLLPLLILTTIIFLSCSKSETLNKVNPTYVGTYLSTSGDTVQVSQNNSFMKIELAFNGNTSHLVFDSVTVSNDLTFTDNETIGQVIYTPPYYQYVSSTGSGNFSSNAVNFHFIINSNGHIIYSGIKTN